MAQLVKVLECQHPSTEAEHHRTDPIWRLLDIADRHKMAAVVVVKMASSFAAAAAAI